MSSNPDFIVPPSYDKSVNTLAEEVLSYYRFAGLPIVDEKTIQHGGVASGSFEQNQATTAEDAARACLRFNGTDCRLAIGFNQKQKTANGAVSVLIRCESTATKQIVVASDAQSSAGGWSLEVLVGGQLRFFLRDADNKVRQLTSRAGAIRAGTASQVGAAWGRAGLKLYLNGSVVDREGGVTDGADHNTTSETSVGAWHTGEAFFDGLIGRLILFSEQPSDAEMATLALPSDRDSFWIDQEYSRVFHVTPQDEDVGDDVVKWFKEVWAGDHPIRSCKITPRSDSGGGELSIAHAPDGTPSIKCVLHPGKSSQACHIFGRQLGPTGGLLNAVFAVEWYRPSVGGQMPNGTRGTYIGTGHHWAASDHSDHIAGGGTFFEDCVSVRVPLDQDNDYFAYAYFPPDLGEGKGRSRKPPGASFRPGTDAWELVELEMNLNDPVSSSNGRLAVYINGVLGVDWPDLRLRTISDVKPRGLGFFLQHNGVITASETSYWRNWKIYTK